jgi:hypothetical protein
MQAQRSVAGERGTLRLATASPLDAAAASAATRRARGLRWSARARSARQAPTQHACDAVSSSVP